MNINFKKKWSIFYTFLLMFTLITLNGCNTQPNPSTTLSNATEITLEGIVLTNGTVFVTKSNSAFQLTHELISMIMPSSQELTVGSLTEFVIQPEILESYPMQANVISIRLLDDQPPVIQAPIYTGPKVINHMPKDSHFIDVRTPEEYAEGHIEGAINLPLDNLEALIANQAPDLTDTIMVYCRSGNRSATAAKRLKELNYAIVFDLGGINAYQGEFVTESP